MRFFENERDFTRWVLGEARSRGWLAAHLSNHRVVRRPDGELRAVADRDATGFPDFVGLHPDHGELIAELKMPGNKPDEKQLAWLVAYRAAGRAVFVWYPRDHDEVLEVLEGRPPSGRLFGDPVHAITCDLDADCTCEPEEATP